MKNRKLLEETVKQAVLEAEALGAFVEAMPIAVDENHVDSIRDRIYDLRYFLDKIQKIVMNGQE
jgi:hypothetical protein